MGDQFNNTKDNVMCTCCLQFTGNRDLLVISEWQPFDKRLPSWFCFRATCSASNMRRSGSLKWTPCCQFFWPTSAGRFAMFGRRRIHKQFEIRLSSPKKELKLHMMSGGPACFVVLETVTCPFCLSDAGFVSKPHVQQATCDTLAL